MYLNRCRFSRLMQPKIAPGFGGTFAEQKAAGVVLPVPRRHAAIHGNEIAVQRGRAATAAATPDRSPDRRRRRMVPIAQRPLQMPGDRLMTLAVNAGGLRPYPIQH
jgi:hypothetical protein